MRKMSFALGALVGAVVATAWAQIPAPASMNAPGYAALINPIEMMAVARSLPVESFDAF